MRTVGHIRAFAAFAGIASAAAFTHTLLVHPFAWSVLRAVTGACLLGIYLVVESWLNLETPATQRGRVFAIYMTVTLLALAGGQWLLNVDPYAGPRGFGLAAALFALGLVPVALTRLPEPKPVGRPQQNFRLSWRGARLALGGTLAAGLATGAFWGMGAVFARRLGLNGDAVAAFMSATIMGGVALQWPLGHLSDRLDRRLVLLGASLFAAATALGTVAAVLWWPSALYAVAFLLGGLLFPLYALSVAHLNDRLDRAQVLEASNTALLVYGAGAVVGPLASGLAMEQWGPLGLLLYMTAVLLAFSLFALLRIGLERPVAPQDRVAFVSLVRTSQAALEMDPRTDTARVPSQAVDAPPPARPGAAGSGTQ